MSRVFGPYDGDPLPWDTWSVIDGIEPSAVTPLTRAPPAAVLKRTQYFMDGLEVCYYVSKDKKTAYRESPKNPARPDDGERWEKIDLTRQRPIAPQIVAYAVVTWRPGNGYEWMGKSPRPSMPAAARALFAEWKQREGRMHADTSSWQGQAKFHVLFQEPTAKHPARIAIFDAAGALLEQGVWVRDPRGFTELRLASAKR